MRVSAGIEKSVGMSSEQEQFFKEEVSIYCSASLALRVLAHI